MLNLHTIRSKIMSEEQDAIVGFISSIREAANICNKQITENINALFNTEIVPYINAIIELKAQGIEIERIEYEPIDTLQVDGTGAQPDVKYRVIGVSGDRKYTLVPIPNDSFREKYKDWYEKPIASNPEQTFLEMRVKPPKKNTV